eukprot:jgi/Bigna1/142004/aug1.66_g16712
MTDRESKQLLEPDEERDGKNARTRYSPFLRIFFSEFYGTFIVSMMTTGALLLSSNITNEVATVERLLMCSLTYGCSFGVAFYALSFAQSDASYGLATVNLRQLNPAVTLCVALMGVCGLGNLGPHRTHIRVGDHQVKAAAKTVQLSMALFVLIAQLCGNFVGVYFALNVISNGYELNPNISLDGVTEDMKWVSGALVSCVAILTIVAVCHHPDSKAKFLRERNVRSIREDTPLSLFEVRELYRSVAL